MKINDKPYGIKCNWDSEYLCQKCGALLYYAMEDTEAKKGLCFNPQCPSYPKGIEIYSTKDSDFKLLNSQFAVIEKNLGQIISTCDYKVLALRLLERRRRIVEKFFISGAMNIDAFLLSNEILLFIQKYKSLGIRNDLRTFKTILQLYKEYVEQLTLVEDLKEGRYLLTRKPVKNKIFRLKYYDIIVDEIWTSYGLINLQSLPDVNAFRYHEVIEKLLNAQGTEISADYAPYFDRLWPFAISAQYLIKRNYASSLKYQYSVTPTDLANILSIIKSLKNDNLTPVSLFNVLMHFIIQPMRDRQFADFINLLSGNNEKIPIVFKMDGDIILDRRTLLLFFILMYSQRLPSDFYVSGQQRISEHKQEASSEYEKFFKDKLEKSGYYCLPTSINIGGLDYDVIALSESNLDILLIETKFKDPSPSSLSAHRLIEQEFIYDKYGLLPQVITHQKRYDLLFQKPDLFRKTLRLKANLQDYRVKAFFITKYTPLINTYGNVLLMSEREFIDKELLPKS